MIQKMDSGLTFLILGAKERKANKIGPLFYHLRSYDAANAGIIIFCHVNSLQQAEPHCEKSAVPDPKGA